jgi:ADP-ribose pyrophosphatase YjhB (NUDIX family)
VKEMNITTVNTAKAITFDGDKVLLIRKEYEDGRIFYTLPGGSQEPGQTLQETLIREMEEETAATVSIIDLVTVYEYSQPSKSNPTLTKHKVEFAFLCQIHGTYSPRLGVRPDPHQTGVEWVEMSHLSKINLYPNKLETIIMFAGAEDANRYLGIVS